MGHARNLVLIALLLPSLGISAAEEPRRPVKAVYVPIPPPGRSVPDLVRALHSPKVEERASSAWALAGIGGRAGDDVIEALEEATHDPEAPVRYGAAWALGHLRKTMPGLDSPARPVRMTRPAYPMAAFSSNTEGSVILDILIGEEGEVAHAERRWSVPAFDEAALNCVRDWKFRPAERNGSPSATTAEVPVSFKIY